MDPANFAELALPVAYDPAAISLNAGAAMLTEVNELLELNDLEWREKRSQHFGGSPESYREEFYHLSVGPALAGIRHLGGDREEAFVHFLLGFFPCARDLEELKALAQNQFAAFAPKSFSIWLRPGASGLPPPLRMGRIFLAGRRIELLGNSRPAHYERVELREQPLDYAWYEKIHEEFHLAEPGQKNWVPITDREELERSKLAHIWVDGTLAGIIAAEEKPFLGEPGLYFSEFLLTNEWKGRGLAAAVQRKFIERELAAQYWGTIDANNQPSLKTALRIGRKSVREELFYSAR